MCSLGAVEEQSLLARLLLLWCGVELAGCEGKMQRSQCVAPWERKEGGLDWIRISVDSFQGKERQGKARQQRGVAVYCDA